MSVNRKTGAITTLLLGLGACLYLFMYALFHGSFDGGAFTIQSQARSSKGEIATVARRSDRQALNNDQFFVVIGDHPPSPKELRWSYYHDGVAFRAGSDCLRIRWESAATLQISCGDGSIDSDSIAVQKTRLGDVTLIYSGIPAMSSR